MEINEFSINSVFQNYFKVRKGVQAAAAKAIFAGMPILAADLASQILWAQTLNKAYCAEKDAEKDQKKDAEKDQKKNAEKDETSLGFVIRSSYEYFQQFDVAVAVFDQLEGPPPTTKPAAAASVPDTAAQSSAEKLTNSPKQLAGASKMGQDVKVVDAKGVVCGFLNTLGSERIFFGRNFSILSAVFRIFHPSRFFIFSQLIFFLIFRPLSVTQATNVGVQCVDQGAAYSPAKPDEDTKLSAEEKAAKQAEEEKNRPWVDATSEALVRTLTALQQQLSARVASVLAESGSAKSMLHELPLGTTCVFVN
jgi:hypothetical protein